MTNLLDVIMLISTVMYSYLLLYCKRSGFIFGIIAAGIMGCILINTGVYVQAILNYIYAITYIYSYISWGGKKSPNISKITNRQIIVSVISVIAFTFIIGYTFVGMGESHPYIDSFSAACSVIAVILLSKKVIEHSYIFALSNIASITICYMAQDYVTILTFLVYMIFNIARGYMWNKELVKEKIK